MSWQRKDKRGSASSRGYGATWRRVRQLHLNRNPLCADCKVKDFHKKAYTVHHVDENQFNNESDNLLSLCFVCHEKRHGRMRDPAGYDADGFPLQEGHPWAKGEQHGKKRTDPTG